MTIGNAKQFIHRGMRDSGFRTRLLAPEDHASLQAILAQEHILFSDHDFDEAFHNLLTQCQTQEQAEQLREFRTWWGMILSLLSRQQT